MRLLVVLGLLLASAATGASCTSDTPAASTPEAVAAAGARVARVTSGHFAMQVEVGASGIAGAELVATSLHGSFDRSIPAMEVIVDLAAVRQTLSPAALGQTGEVADTLVLRVIGEQGYLSTSESGGGWVEVPLTEAEVPALLGIADPDSFTSLLGHAVEVSSSSRGEVMDGVSTTVHRGWLSGRSMAEASEQGVERLLPLLEAAPPEITDRMLRFELWVGADGIPRRLVIALDTESLAAVADRLDGSGDAVRSLVMRYEIDWWGLGEPVGIEVPVEP